MNNDVNFVTVEGRILQEDEINQKKAVKFYCDQPFEIDFNPDFQDENHRDPNDSDPLKAGTNRTFESRAHGDNPARGHRIKIKFKDMPKEGFKYTVKIVGLPDLDPRVVPPR